MAIAPTWNPSDATGAARVSEANKAAIHAACSHCASGSVVSYRPETREWVHRRSAQVRGGSQFSITLCGANELRRSGQHG